MDERLLSNIVPKENLRIMQSNVLKNVSDAVMKTAGPYGSNTMILNPNGAAPSYSKDGKKVLGHIKYYGPLESSITEELHEIVTHVVAEVGDGTTSATRMAYYIFKGLIENESKRWENIPTHDIIDTFKKVTKKLQNSILENGREATLDDIYNICMISTNGDEVVSKNISDIYQKYGKDVHITLNTATGTDHVIKEYDGLTLNQGYPSPAYINFEDKCEIPNPHIYYFEDPVDTPEMINLFTRIIYDNILLPASTEQKLTPTVVFVPSISRDVKDLLAQVETTMYNGTKYPLLIVSNLTKYTGELDDICKLCGCPPIHKYIDPSVYIKDVETGKAPTPDTVCKFYGSAERVIASATKTKIDNPKEMFNYETGDYTPLYYGMIDFLKKSIAEQEETADDKIQLGLMKRRLHTLTANSVDYYIGGVSIIDRDAIKDLAEDAIYSCRSAIMNGVGYGCNFEGFNAATKLVDYFNDCEVSDIKDSLEDDIAAIIRIAYENMIIELYETAMAKDKAVIEVNNSVDVREMPINLRTLEYDGTVLSSIRTDVEILEAISKIVTIMFTANQALVAEPMMNKYADHNKK